MIIGDCPSDVSRLLLANAFIFDRQRDSAAPFLSNTKI